MGIETYFFFPAQLCFFLAGILLHRMHVTLAIDTLDRRFAGGVLIVIVALFIWFDMLPTPVAPYVIYATFIPAIPILFALTRKSRFDIELGNLSYPIYIVHMLILSMASNILNQAGLKASGGMISLIILGAVLVASMLLYVIVERPVDKIRQSRVGAPRINAKVFAAFPQLVDIRPLRSSDWTGYRYFGFRI